MGIKQCGEFGWMYFWRDEDDDNDGVEGWSTTPWRAKPRKMARNAGRLAMNSPCPLASRRLSRERCDDGVVVRADAGGAESRWRCGKGTFGAALSGLRGRMMRAQ